MKIFNKSVSTKSIRVHESTDICDVYCVYAEFTDGSPLTEDELYELDEVSSDLLNQYHDRAVREAAEDKEIYELEQELAEAEEEYLMRAAYEDRLKSVLLS